ncbi:MAG: hypothetical protein H0V34_15620 [Gammaproteobacteria bacterium]|nr:hypothetical protein [Gammaproteobacteria bacterium]
MSLPYLARHCLAVCLAAMMTAAPTPSAAQEEGEDRSGDLPEVNYLELGARLVADGNYARAAAALRNVNVKAAGVDVARYHTLRGLVALRQGDAQQAVGALSKATIERRTRPGGARDPADVRAKWLAYIYLAQAHYQLQNYAQTLRALARSGPIGSHEPALAALRADSHWQLHQRVAAFAALNRGAARFPNDPQFLRRKVFYLIDMGFYRAAATLGQAYLRVVDAGADDYLAIGSALRQSSQLDLALKVLERARLEFPFARDINVELAHVYLDAGKPHVAADLFARTAVIHRDILPEAAELERRAGNFYRALLLNTWIANQKAKLKQRLAMFVGQERWAMAAAMGGALARNGLLADDEIRYAWAYSLFKSGEYDAAEHALVLLERGDLFDKAVELRRAMATCRQARWQCL